jgi:hypothetical protein
MIGSGRSGVVRDGLIKLPKSRNKVKLSGFVSFGARNLQLVDPSVYCNLAAKSFALLLNQSL